MLLVYCLLSVFWLSSLVYGAFVAVGVATASLLAVCYEVIPVELHSH